MVHPWILWTQAAARDTILRGIEDKAAVPEANADALWGFEEAVGHDDDDDDDNASWPG